jgi:Protein of unknown function (DUF3224)
MTAHAEGTFTVMAWDESTYQDLAGKSKLTRASMTFGYTGDLEATGGSETLMFYREDGTATFTGLQRMEGRLGDRAGSFVLLADGTFDGAEAKTGWQVLDGSGTGDLRGLRGSGSSVAGSGPDAALTFIFDYDLG